MKIYPSPVPRTFAVLFLALFAFGMQTWGAPVITVQPARNQVVDNKAPVSFSVSAQGSGVLRYQWLHNGRAIGGVASSTYSLTSAQYSDRGYYQVKVTDSTGYTIISQAGFLNIVVPAEVRVWGYNTGGGNTPPLGLSGVVALSAGDNQNLALKSDGTVVAWGYRDESNEVPAGLSDVVAISSGFVSVALKSDGTVVAWGKNASNQKGLFNGLSGIVAISEQLALRFDGTVVGWNFEGDEPHFFPAGLSDVIAISTGGSGAFLHGLALKSNGTVVAWGANDYGQASVPEGLSGVIAISAGGRHSLALKSDGTVAAWGNSNSGVTAVPYGSINVTAISAGEDHSILLQSNGMVRAWGSMEAAVPKYGQALVPSEIADVTTLDAGAAHNLALELPFLAPIATTKPATSVRFDSATLNGEIDPVGLVTSVYFQFRTDPLTYIQATPTRNIGSETLPITYGMSKKELLPDTTYYYRVAAVNSRTTTYGAEQSFTTPLAPPTILAIAALPNQPPSVLVSGSINPNGMATSVYFEQRSGSGTTFRNAVQELGGGTTPVTVTQTLSFLQLGDVYQVRLVAIDAAGTRYSSYNTFSTDPLPVPTVGPAELSQSAPNSATLSAQVNPNGTATTVYFEYGLTVNYGARSADQAIGAGFNEVSSSADITAFAALHLIHFRAVAVSGKGISYGSDQTFTSSAAAPLLSNPFSKVRTAVDTIVISGTCNPNGFPTKVHLEHAGSYYYSRLTDDQDIGSGYEPVPLSNTVVNLGVISNLYRIVATNAQGTTSVVAATPTPGAKADLVSIVNGSVRIDVLSNDAYEWFFGETPTISSITQGAFGTVAINADLTLQYTPGPDFHGSDDFTYTIPVDHTGATLSTAGVTVRSSLQPFLKTEPAFKTGADAVTLGVRVNPSGAATTVYFEYGTTADYGTKTAEFSVATGYEEAAVSVYLADLPSNLIHFRAVAVNLNGITYGADQTSAENLNAPTAITGTASSIGFSYAILYAICNPNGGATRVHFEYGDTADLGSSFPEQEIGSGIDPVPVSQQIVFHDILGNYHIFYRVVATNAQGTVFGQINTYPQVVTPHATNDFIAVKAHGPIRISVLDNDFLADKINAVTQGAMGAVVINPDQTVQYSPGPNFKGSDSFTYSIASGPESISTATVEIRYFDKLPAGTYVGLVLSDPVMHETSGYLRATLTKSGTFSARLQYAGKSYIMKGRLSDYSPAGYFDSRIHPLNSPALVVRFALVQEEGSPLKVTITEENIPNGKVVAFMARKSPFKATAPCALAGRYTAGLPLQTASSDPAQPRAAGYAVITITASGVGRVAGKLGDGTSVSIAGLMDDHNELPLYSALYGSKPGSRGSVFGKIQFDTTESPTRCTALLHWFKPANASDRLYPAGFTTTLSLTGALYSPAAPPLTFLSTQPNADLTISDGNLAVEMDKELSVTSSYRVGIMTPASDRLAVRFNPGTGLFSGSFRDISHNASRSFNGVILQHENIGTGLFSGGTETGTVLLEPRSAQQ